MAILIKGMEMPKNCAYCPCEHYECGLMGDEHNGVDVTTYFEGDKRHPGCPLIKVPPHGRLIDADALANNMGVSGCKSHRNRNDPNYMYDHNTLMRYEIMQTIDDAPTIIESEGV